MDVDADIYEDILKWTFALTNVHHSWGMNE